MQSMNQKKQNDEEYKEIEFWRPIKFDPSKKYKYILRNPLFNFFSNIIYYLIVPILYLIDKIFLGYKVYGKENIKNVKGGKITISNHIHYMDCTIDALALMPWKIHFLSMQGNFQIPVIRHIIRILGAIPIPTKIEAKKECYSELDDMLKAGKILHIYPEGKMHLYSKEINEFKNGTFKIAAKNRCTYNTNCLKMYKTIWNI